MDQITFDVKRNSRPKRIFSYKPTIVGYYSVDTNRLYRNDLSQLKYIRFPENGEVEFDLDAGRSLAIKKDEDNYVPRIEFILKWITENFGKDDWVKPQIVCTRGVLKQLFLIPYLNKKSDGDDWMICATKWRGTIYVCIKDTIARDDREGKTEKHKQCKSWGYKFEQFMCSGEPDGVPDTAPPVNQREELTVMFRARLNSHHLLLGAEMDGVKSKTRIENCAELASAEFVELKTMAEDSDQKYSFRRYKLLNWWRQSYPVGVRHIVTGIRDESGVLHRLQHYDIADLPKMAEGLWDPCVCVSFCDRFLHFLKGLVTEDDPNVVSCFRYEPHRGITAVQGPAESTFLPPWFVSATSL